MKERRCVRTATDKVVSKVMDRIRRNRLENSPGLFVNRSVLSVSLLHLRKHSSVYPMLEDVLVF